MEFLAAQTEAGGIHPYYRAIDWYQKSLELFRNHGGFRQDSLYDLRVGDLPKIKDIEALLFSLDLLKAEGQIKQIDVLHYLMNFFEEDRDPAQLPEPDFGSEEGIRYRQEMYNLFSQAYNAAKELEEE